MEVIMNIQLPTHLKKEWALVTGASSGIGYACAIRLAQLGMNVIITARREAELSKLKQIIENHQVSCEVICLDLTTPNASLILRDQIKAKNLSPHVFINNAGKGLYGNFQNQTTNALESMLTLNITTMTLLCNTIASIMPKQSYLLLVASTICFQPTPLYAAYAASKSYIHSFGLALNYELKPNIHVCTLYPGMTKTAFFKVSHQRLDPMLSSLLMMDADYVASTGIKALFKHKPRVIAGIRNKLLACFSKITPDTITCRIIAWMLKSTRQNILKDTK